MGCLPVFCLRTSEGPSSRPEPVQAAAGGPASRPPAGETGAFPLTCCAAPQGRGRTRLTSVLGPRPHLPEPSCPLAPFPGGPCSPSARFSGGLFAFLALCSLSLGNSRECQLTGPACGRAASPDGMSSLSSGSLPHRQLAHGPGGTRHSTVPSCTGWPRCGRAGADPQLAQRDPAVFAAWPAGVPRQLCPVSVSACWADALRLPGRRVAECSGLAFPSAPGLGRVSWPVVSPSVFFLPTCRIPLRTEHGSALLVCGVSTMVATLQASLCPPESWRNLRRLPVAPVLLSCRASGKGLLSEGLFVPQWGRESCFLGSRISCCGQEPTLAFSWLPRGRAWA